MQYTGTSFSAQFTAIFDNILLTLRREELPEGPFHEKTGHLGTHCVDAVERRIFEALGEGESVAGRLTAWLTEEPRVGFALGLVVLGLICAAALAGST
jgi:hydrogenase-4 component B